MLTVPFSLTHVDFTWSTDPNLAIPGCLLGPTSNIVSPKYLWIYIFFFFKCDKAQLITSVRISGELIVQSV